MSVISIDLWGTLIKSSPLFVEAKIRLTQEHFNIHESQIPMHYNVAKKELNAIIESTGWMPTTRLMFTHLFNKLSNGPMQWSPDFVKSFIAEYNLLAESYPPELYSVETIKYLELLSSENKLILSSNTMLIDGTTLSEILDHLGVRRYFKSMLFSDHVGYSKPDSIMYGKSDYHIGDNPITDGIGARNAGSKPIIINSNEKTIKDAYNIISQGK